MLPLQQRWRRRCELRLKNPFFIFFLTRLVLEQCLYMYESSPAYLISRLMLFLVSLSTPLITPLFSLPNSFSTNHTFVIFIFIFSFLNHNTTPIFF
jgi:hypothetical protein